MAQAQRAPLALTPGEPAGVGAEIALKAWRRPDMPAFFLIDDPDRVAALSRACGLNIPVAGIAEPDETWAARDRGLPVLARAFGSRARPGQPDAANAAAVVQAIRDAVDMTTAGAAAGIVTNPIQKHCLRQAGFRHPGHTEFLGALTGAARPVMMLASDQLRVVPLTIHEPLRRVPDLLRHDLVIDTARILAAALTADFAIDNPRIAVAGLNPHAGEAGTIGTEDGCIIAPAVDALRADGIRASGPYPADSMFHAEARAGYDAALCMYHDQALIPLKTLDFWGGVNVTLGLPLVRTSPDHGTALDLAGTGAANEASLVAALRLAAAMAGRRAATPR